MNQVNKNTPQVLIVGAGPSGLMMACQLASFNIGLRIIDKKQLPSSHSGAMIMHARSIEIFDQMGLAQMMIGKGRIVNGLSVYFNGKKSVQFDLRGIGHTLTQFPFMLMLEQSETEAILIGYLQQKGIQVEWDTELINLVQLEHGVDAELILSDGSREKVIADYLVAADGGKSTVRSFLKIPFKGKSHNTFLSVMECDADILSPPDQLLFSFSGQATTGFFPLQKGNWRIDAAIRRMRASRRLSFYSVQEKFNRKTSLNANIRNPGWFSVFYSHSRNALFYRVHRCFLIGDAAHLFTPVGGQGMNTGLHDAHNLAWKLAMVLKGNMPTSVLGTYQSERKPVAIRTCHASDRFFKLAASGSIVYTLFRKFLLPPLLKLFFKIMKVKRVSDFVFKKIAGLEISYPENSLNIKDTESVLASAPNPGERVPYFSYPDTGGRVVSINEKLSGTKFNLIIFEGDGSSKGELPGVVKRFSNSVSAHVIPLNHDTADLYVRFAIKKQGWYMVRPDQFIACRSVEPGAEKLLTCLQQLFIHNRNGTESSP